MLSGEKPGLLAYLDGIPVGWCRLGPRETFDRLEHSPRLARVDDEEVWSVVCFYVHPSAKRKGVAAALLESALTRAAARLSVGVSRARGGSRGCRFGARSHGARLRRSSDRRRTLPDRLEPR